MAYLEGHAVSLALVLGFREVTLPHVSPAMTLCLVTGSGEASHLAAPVSTLAGAETAASK